LHQPASQASSFNLFGLISTDDTSSKLGFCIAILAFFSILVDIWEYRLTPTLRGLLAV
ncbi:uncharacterized protein BT62DRAFT_995045, partial [Guyanagaster necrorhizus]